MIKREKGFTLIELLVVIAIIAILATLVLIALGDARDSARDADRKGAISQVRSLAQLYHAEEGSYTGLESDTRIPADAAGSSINVSSGSDAWCADIQLSDGTNYCTDTDLEFHEDSSCSGSHVCTTD